MPLQVRSLVEEYFASGDVADVAESLENMGSAVGGPAEVSREWHGIACMPAERNCLCIAMTEKRISHGIQGGAPSSHALHCRCPSCVSAFTSTYRNALPPATLPASMQHLSHYFVKRLLTLALDRKDREREAASVLLSNLYAEVWRVGAW